MLQVKLDHLSHPNTLISNPWCFRIKAIKVLQVIVDMKWISRLPNVDHRFLVILVKIICNINSSSSNHQTSLLLIKCNQILSITHLQTLIWCYSSNIISLSRMYRCHLVYNKTQIINNLYNSHQNKLLAPNFRINRLYKKNLNTMKAWITKCKIWISKSICTKTFRITH